MSKRSASRSTILPLPSSPHWAPITAITLDISRGSNESKPHNFFIEFQIFFCGSRPGMVCRHSVLLELQPMFRPAIKVKCLAYFFKQRARLIWSKLETRAAAVRRIELLDRVVESASRAHDRHGAVAHAVHLIQTTRFVQRRHQKHVGTRFDLMGQRLARVAFVDPDSLRRDVVPVLQEVFILARARAECDEERSGLENLSGDLTDQIVAFLTNQSRDDSDDRSIRIFG